MSFRRKKLHEHAPEDEAAAFPYGNVEGVREEVELDAEFPKVNGVEAELDLECPNVNCVGVDIIWSSTAEKN